ncbi:MAG: helix-turn-helix domain-containing protein [Candidatus Nanoarchaeia archaeon]
MYRITVKTIINNPIAKDVLREMTKYVAEIIFLSRKRIGKDRLLLSKTIVKGDMEKALKFLLSMPFAKKIDYEIVSDNVIIANMLASEHSPRFFFDFPSCNCILEKASFKDWIVTQIILTWDKKCFEKHLQNFKKSNEVIDIKYEDAALGELTFRQHQIIRNAYELGYFEFPKKVNLKKLAKLWGISPVAVLETLKAAERKILAKYLS